MKIFASILVGVSLLMAGPALADDAATIETWYAALAKADGVALDPLLAPNAVINLIDIGTTQTKAEFIDSMGEWKSAIEGGTIRHKADGVVDGALAYEVCYDFAENDLMTREVFTFESGLIVKSDQTTLAENCDDF